VNTEQRTGQTIAVFDLDGTIADCDTYVKFLKLCLIRQPRRALRSLHLPFAVLLHKSGVYDNTWLKETFLSAIAGGYSSVTLSDIVDTHVDDVMQNHIRQGALPAIRRHREAGHRLLLASASFDFYVKQLGDRLGFDDVVCTRAMRGPDNVLLGKIEGRNCYGDAKVDAVLSAIPERDNCTLIAYSDHHSDWALLRESDVPVAVNPTRELIRLASAQQIDVQMW